MFRSAVKYLLFVVMAKRKAKFCGDNVLNMDRCSDLKSVAAYLRSLPASGKHPVQAFTMSERGKTDAALSYEVNCSACHGLEGEGIKGMVPSFAGNQAMQQDPTNMIHAMLRGARAPHTVDRQTAAGMPAFDWKMDDQQMADIVNYVRNSWGNRASEVSAEQVSSLRKATQAQDKLKTPASN